MFTIAYISKPKVSLIILKYELFEIMNLKFKYYSRLAILIVCINLKFCTYTCDPLFTRFEPEVSILIFLSYGHEVLNNIIGSMMVDVVLTKSLKDKYPMVQDPLEF